MRTTMIIAILASLMVFAVFAAPHIPAGAQRVVLDVTYSTVEGINLKMDIYYPKAEGSSYPAVMYVHGGGWTGGSKSGGAGMYDIPTLLAHGYVVVSIDYRLAPRWKFPAQIEDVKCAVRYLRSHSQDLSIDPNRIGAYGGSAGGHLVALLGTSPDSEFSADCPSGGSARVQAVVDMFGPADFSQFGFNKSDKAFQVFGASDVTDPILAQASPVTWVSPDDTPFLILHGDKDPVVPLSQSQILYDRLQAAGVPAELVVVKNAGHGFKQTGGAIDPSRSDISEMIATFFDRWLKESAHVPMNQVAKNT